MAADLQDATVSARDKYHCPACGAEATWSPPKQALICPFCGTESPAELQRRGDHTVIIEHDLAVALRGLPDAERGWQAEKTSVQCQSCRAISVFEATRIGQRCEFCGSAQLVPYEAVQDAFRPESLLPLKIGEGQARDLIRAWYHRQWLAPTALRTKALTDTAKGVYLPYWTFDARADAQWTADAGTYYTARVGRRRVRRIRWQPAAGALSHVFDDELVCASTDVGAPLLREVEPFPATDLIPYDPGYLAGWTVERYQIDLVRAAARSREQMDAALRQLCARQVPGDTYRNLVVRASYSDQRFKHILAPVWLLIYTFRGQSYHVVVNGATGRIAGERPWSWVKILLLVLAVFLVVLAIALNS